MDATAFHRAGSGEPMVLIHGFTDTWRTWTRVLPALEREYDVFAPTLPGHWGAEPLGNLFSWEAMVPRVEQMLDDAGIERAHLVGNSLGGWVALELAARGRALSVVGLSPAGGWEFESAESRRVRRIFLRMYYGTRYNTARLEQIAARPRLRRLALRDAVAHPERLSATEAIGLIRGAANCAITRELLEHSKTTHFGELAPFDAPVRIAWGTRDRLLPYARYSSRLRRLLPDAELMELPGLGHLPQWDDPDLVVRTITEFCRSSTRAPSKTPAPAVVATPTP